MTGTATSGAHGGKTTPFHLRGNYAPVDNEVTAFDLPMDGQLPSELSGRYLRNGANPLGADPGAERARRPRNRRGRVPSIERSGSTTPT